MSCKVVINDKILDVPMNKIKDLMGLNITINNLGYKEVEGSVDTTIFEHYSLYPKVTTSEKLLIPCLEFCNVIRNNDDYLDFFWLNR